MNNTAIKVENLYKEYRLGVIGYGTLREDIQSLWARVRGKEDPNSLIGRNNYSGDKDHILALNDVSFEVKKGEVLGIIGKNGAGKSTLLKILSRITAPTRGQIKIKGRIGSLLEVGTGFHPELTGKENIFLNGAILGMHRREIQRKLEEIIEFSGVEQFIDTPVKRYSSGMYVRLAFAVAAHLDSEILIIDEVLAVGDAEFQKKCLGKMDDVAKRQGRTVLFVSHNMGAINLLCKKAIMLFYGKIRLSGNTRDVITEYLNINNEEINLSNLKNRSGSGKAKVYDIYLTDLKNNKINEIELCTPFNIILEILFNIESIGHSISLNLVVSDTSQIRLFSLASEVTGKQIKIAENKMIFCCHLLNGLPLLPGSYFLTFSIEINGILADKAFDVFKIDVISKDIYNSKRLPYSHLGNFIVLNEWSTLQV